MSLADQIDKGNRHLKAAEDSHAQDHRETAMLWYLRAINHFLAALCEAELKKAQNRK